MVFLGFVMAWRFAGSPTLRSPLSANPIIEGVVRFPSEFAITTGSLPSKTATHEFVNPRSIPIIFPIVWFLSIFFCYYFLFCYVCVPSLLYSVDSITLIVQQRLCQYAPMCQMSDIMAEYG